METAALAALLLLTAASAQSSGDYVRPIAIIRPVAAAERMDTKSNRRSDLMKAVGCKLPDLAARLITGLVNTIANEAKTNKPTFSQ